MAGLDGLDPNFAAGLQALIDASGGSIYIVSGYRTVERQEQLWQEALAKYGDPEIADNWVARPGSSRHNFGMAADLGGNLKLAAQLAPQFGLVFPMSHEPWHIEPYGAASGEHSPHVAVPAGGASAPEDLLKRPDVQMFVFTQLLQGADPNAVMAMVQQTFAPQGASKPVQPGLNGANVVTSGQGSGADPASIQQIAGYLKQAGFQGEPLAIMTAIALRESGGRIDATGDTDKTGGQWGPSVGWFQIRTLDDQRGTGGWRDEDFLRADPMNQALAAWNISGGGTNFGPWSVYNNDMYLEDLDRVRSELGI